MSPTLFLLLVLAQPGGGGARSGATSRPAPAAADATDAYIDGNEAFSIRPPANWRLFRQRTLDASGVTLLRMIGPPLGGQDQTITLRRSGSRKRMSIEEMIKSVADAMSLEFSDVRIGAQQVQQLAERPAGVVTATYAHEGLRWFRMEAIVETWPRDYFSVVYNGPAQAGSQGERLFQTVISSLVFLPPKISDEELKRALEEGAAWAGSVTEADLRRALTPRQFLRIEVDGGTTGFTAMEQSEFVYDRRAGVRLTERGWSFERDGVTRSLDAAMFLSGDLQDERWQTKVLTLVPAAGDKPAMLESAKDEGVRVKDMLISSQSYVYGQPAQQNPSLKLPRTYLSRALVRLLPRLVKDLGKPRRMAFTTFDHQRADLVVRIVEMRGESPPPTGVTAVGKVYRIEEREGLASDASVMYVDQAGRVVFMQAGKVTMRPAREDELQQLLGGRVADVDRQMRELEALYKKDAERFHHRPGGS